MQTPLLRTKLFIPPTRAKLVDRAHLIRHLNEGLHRKFTLISAPAGYGKTTLVSSWVDQYIRPGSGLPVGETAEGTAIRYPSRVAWVSLDESENEPLQFWLYIIAALQTIEPSLGKTMQAMLTSGQPPPFDVLVTVLINDLAEYQMAVGPAFRLLLVLDDYHQITAQPIHDSLNFLIDHLPPVLHPVIITRSDPPLNLASRQGRAEVNQIRASDLSFDNTEVEEFLNKQMGLELSNVDIAALESRTEGWIVGLQLAAVSLQEQADRHSFVTRFAGDDRYIADYLMDVVLQHQSGEMQAFLLQTSILDQLSPALCDAVTGQTQSRARLTQLERANLFLTPLDNRREWYRYHHLFADLLRQRLRESSSRVEVTGLYERAFTWHALHGDITEAVGYALQAGSYVRVAQLLEEHGDVFFAQHKLVALTNWIGMLPDEIMAAMPKLCMVHAWALLATGRPAEAERWLERIEMAVDGPSGGGAAANLAAMGPDTRRAMVEVMVVRAVLAINQFDIAKTIELCQLVLPFLQDEQETHLLNNSPALRLVVTFNMGLAYVFSGEGGAAVEALTEAVTLSIDQNNMNILPMAMAHLGQLQILQGQLQQAEQTYLQALRLSREEPGGGSPMAGFAEIGLGDVLYEANDLERAKRHLENGIAQGKVWNHAEILLAGHLGLARLHQAQGDYPAALDSLETLEDFLRRVKADMFLPALEAGRTRIWLAQGKLAAAERWAKAAKLQPDGPLSFLQENDYLTLARLLIAQAKHEAAAGLLGRLRAFAEAGERWGRVTEIMLLQALVLQGQGKTPQAESLLAQALSRAWEAGYVRLFVDEGAPMAHLLYQLAVVEAPGGYAARILQAMDADAGGAGPVEDAAAASGSPLVEPLSDREMEVLACLVEGLSNRAIAQRLSISLTTVKSHTRNIYGKLEVNSRTQAAAKARAWGLLPPD